jgi:hypothetical protein
VVFFFLLLLLLFSELVALNLFGAVIEGSNGAEDMMD